MNIKERAYQIANVNMKNKCSPAELEDFAKALIAETQKQNEPVGYLRTTEKALVFMPLTHVKDGEYFFTESQLIAAVAKKDEEIAGMRKQIGKQAMTIGEYMDAERELQAAQEEWNQCSGLLDDAYRSIEMLEDQLAKAEQRVAEYNELIYAVQTKNPDETRHQTALRYIRNAENRPSNTAANGASS